MDQPVEALDARRAANPFESEAHARLAHQLLDAGDYPAACEEALTANTLGYGEFGEMLLLAARCALRAGDTESGTALVFAALDQKLRDLEPLRTDADFAVLREDPAFAGMLGITTEPDMDRTQRWQFDIAFFEQELKRRAVSPYGVMSADAFAERFDWLDEAIPALSDARILLELDRLLVPLRDGHAYVAPALDRPDLLAALPLAFYRFTDGVHITVATPRYAELVGSQLLAIDSRPIDEIAEQLWSTICTDNEQWPLELIPFRLRETPLLHALELTNAPDRVTLTVQGNEGPPRDHLVVADDEFPTAPLGRNFPFPADWVSVLDKRPEPPLYIRDLRTPFWYAPLPELNAVYFQLNAVRDSEMETLAAFSERFFAMLESEQPQRLIIDIRLNKGGNTTLEWPFLHRLIASPLNARGRLFVIIGRRTWSAAQNFATYLDFHTEAIFVGEPTGSCPTFNGESIEFALPCSGTRVNISDLHWQSGWPADRRPWIPPDLYAPPSFDAYRAGRDVALEAIAQEIAQPTLP